MMAVRLGGSPLSSLPHQLMHRPFSFYQVGFFAFIANSSICHPSRSKMFTLSCLISQLGDAYQEIEMLLRAQDMATHVCDLLYLQEWMVQGWALYCTMKPLAGMCTFYWQDMFIQCVWTLEMVAGFETVAFLQFVVIVVLTRYVTLVVAGYLTCNAFTFQSEIELLLQVQCSA